MSDLTPGLLPVSGATLATDARVLGAVQGISARYGVDYTNDAAVTALLAEGRRAVRASQRGWLAWTGGLALAAGVTLPVTATELPSRTAKLALLAAGVLLVAAVAALTTVRTRWKRALTHPPLNGYREVLGVARAHGLPLTHVPAWLEGRASGGTGKGAAPIPTYPSAQPPAVAPTAAVPPKPPAVTRYEEAAAEGGWHDEVGCLLLLAALIGAGWAWSQDTPLAYALLALIPLAILTWLAGSRQGEEKEALQAEALAYVRSVTAAQAAGAQVPELSRVLKRLLEDD